MNVPFGVTVVVGAGVFVYAIDIGVIACATDTVDFPMLSIITIRCWCFRCRYSTIVDVSTLLLLLMMMILMAFRCTRLSLAMTRLRSMLLQRVIVNRFKWFRLNMHRICLIDWFKWRWYLGQFFLPAAQNQMFESCCWWIFNRFHTQNIIWLPKCAQCLSPSSHIYRLLLRYYSEMIEKKDPILC